MGGDVLFVGHASTLDACAQQLIGNEPRSMHDMMQVVRKGGVLSEIFNTILKVTVGISGLEIAKKV